MFKVYWTNHGYYSAEQFTSLDAAVAYGKSKCFDFQVTHDEKAAAAWSYFNGLRTY